MHVVHVWNFLNKASATPLPPPTLPKNIKFSSGPNLNQELMCGKDPEICQISTPHL